MVTVKKFKNFVTLLFNASVSKPNSLRIKLAKSDVFFLKSLQSLGFISVYRKTDKTDVFEVFPINNKVILQFLKSSFFPRYQTVINFNKLNELQMLGFSGLIWCSTPYKQIVTFKEAVEKKKNGCIILIFKLFKFLCLVR